MSLKDEKREKAKDLIRLALDEGAADEERRSTAVRAIKIIQKYKLLDLTAVDGVLEHPIARAVKTVADTLADSDFTDARNELLDWAKSAVATAAAKRRRR